MTSPERTSAIRTASTLLLLSITLSPIAAQEDTLRTYSLSDIEVSASRTLARSSFTSEQLTLAEIEAKDAASIADVVRSIPAAHLQTNSRGETLVYLRNAGERQVAVFFDGALLNIPWDNRIDLSVVPAAAIGGITVAQGVPPVEYGTNVLGGAVNLTSRTIEGGSSTTDITTLYGTADRIQGSVSHRGTGGRVSYTLVASHSVTDGMPLPSDVSLPFSQNDADLRSNTDSRITNVFGRGVYRLDGGGQLGLTLMHVDSKKGVAPEGHLDPAVSNVRFWRYPDWRSTTAIVTGQGLVGHSTFVRGSAWINSFGQTIDAYASAAYDTFDERQEDDDLTLGTRLVGTRNIGTSTLKLALNALTSTHHQRDLELSPNGNVVPDMTFPELEFQQHLVSAGVEYGLRPSPTVTLTAGLSIDGMATPKTGDKPDLNGFADYGATFGAQYDAGRGWFLRSALGRKTRFPTMRELFGAALNRFLINPDLQPESSILAEMGVGLARHRWSAEVVPFGSFTSNTIDQQSVTLEGETVSRRQRINTAGSRVLGIQFVATIELIDHVTAEANLTLMDVTRHQDTPTDPTRLSEKPEALGWFVVNYRGPQGTTGLVEAAYTGRAYSLDEANTFVPLNTSLVFNARVSQRFSVNGRNSLEIFLRADNITDEIVTPQLGLPGPGRSVAGGVKATL